MQSHRPTTKIIVGAALALAFTFTAQAQNSRSFVATTGNDANNCSASQYCRTFARALAVTNAGGEIVVVDSGGYGPVTISQPVVITAIGIDASITATSGDALDINTTGNVTITGLNLNGAGRLIGIGVHVAAVGLLRLYNMQIQNFGVGIDFEATSSLAVYDSEINDCADGILQASGGQVSVSNTELDNDGIGAYAAAGTMTIADSSVHYNGIGFFANGGKVSLKNDRVIFNETGIDAFDGGALYFADCLIFGNTTSYSIGTGSTIMASSPGTSLITPGQSSTGTLGTAITLK